MITAGSANDAAENTGRSSMLPTVLAGFLAAPCEPPPRYADAIDRMSIRPEPSPPPCWAEPEDALAEDPPLDDDDDDDDARGASLASAARLPSENRTEFSLRSPRSLPPALS